MDPRKRKHLEDARKQALGFQRLQGHADFASFMSWLEKGRADYLAQALEPTNRGDHVTLARALQGYDALNDVLTNFERAINGIPKLNAELDAAE